MPTRSSLQRFLRGLVRRTGFDVVRSRPRNLLLDGRPIADFEFYTPLFAPWHGYEAFAKYRKLAQPYTLVSPDRCWVLYCLAQQCMQLPGDLWECGVYKGGTARMLAELLADSPTRGDATLHLFDTFSGMPATDPRRDLHQPGDFADTSLDAVMTRVGHPGLVHYHPGLIPTTFATLEHTSIAFAHIDVDIHKAVLDCCEFILPRLVIGGVMVFDDYGFPTCPGARQAVDAFFAGTPFVPLVLPTGQALVFKSSAWPAGSAGAQPG